MSQVGGKKKQERQQTNEPEKRPGDDYKDPHPESITSLCYSCKRYSDCNVKTGTCKKCDQYINKAEAEKTEEQRYSEEQERIDRETRKKLREMEDEEKMKQEEASLRNIDDSFKKIIIVGEDTPVLRNEAGITTIGIYDFLLNENSLDL